eukprot:CAMPEP_0118888088 /NCGR_PEP_ID=MMETSP1163-20130328/25544_1 /TAXON_ID=124430 /ORGANISM="Phaeomonas parva, Strain CCMP2877" /LENGTH=306 /DNA_ID=CAMNT_0006826651 /DNA_START=71 /DNA_END=992 /DNA_ORIENTATION=-
MRTEGDATGTATLHTLSGLPPEAARVSSRLTRPTVRKPLQSRLHDGAGPVEGLLDDGDIRVHEGLDEHAGGGPHRKAAVLKLHERPLLVDAVLGKLERVEAAVARDAAHVVGVLRLEGADDKNDLDDAEGRGRLEGLEAVRGREGVREAGHLLGEDAGRGEHAHAAVLKLGLTEVGKVAGVREAERVEADVTGELAVEVFRLVREGDGSRLVGGHGHLAAATDAGRRERGGRGQGGEGNDEAEHDCCLVFEQVGLTEVGKVAGVREAERVEADVTGELAVEVFRLVREGDGSRLVGGLREGRHQRA